MLLSPSRPRCLLLLKTAAKRSIVTSQLPVDSWHDVIPDPTVADAVLDRLVHTAHRLALKGESLRKPSAENKPEKPVRRGRLDTNDAE